jgi:hypothetical protein
MLPLGANPLLTEHSPFQGCRSVQGYPRKEIATAGTIYNCGAYERVFIVEETIYNTVEYTVPSGVDTLSIQGYGARGASAQQTWRQLYDKFRVVSTTSNGSTVYNPPVNMGRYQGAMPANYCDAVQYFSGYSTQACYNHVDQSFWQETSPATLGEAVTAFGRTLYGGYGGSNPSMQTIDDIPVVAGDVSTIVVPGGGQITISYYRNVNTNEKIL